MIYSQKASKVFKRLKNPILTQNSHSLNRKNKKGTKKNNHKKLISSFW
jgi:hypothetical protein